MADSATEWIDADHRGCRRDRIARLEWLVEHYPATATGLS